MLDLLCKLCLMNFFRHQDHISDGIAVRYSMSDKDCRIDAKDRGSSVIFLIELVKVGVFHPSFQKYPVHGFNLFKYDVADESVANDHIHVIPEQFPSFYVPDKIIIL